MRKLDDLKARGMEKVHRVQSNVQTSMKSSPMKWAGIAVGSGFALGLLGRLIHWRNYQRRMTPELVIIESNC